MNSERAHGSMQPRRHVAYVALLLTALLAAGLGAARPAAQPPSIVIREAWIRWLPAGVPAGGYLTLRNDGDRPEVLSQVSSPDFGDITLHRSVTHAGITAMEPVAQIVVPPHRSLRFAPGGYHLMLSRPTRPVRPGDQVRIEFHFSDGSTVAAGFEVRAPDADGSPP